jgi:hypothetical protein
MVAKKAPELDRTPSQAELAAAEAAIAGMKLVQPTSGSER